MILSSLELFNGNKPKLLCLYSLPSAIDREDWLRWTEYKALKSQQSTDKIMASLVCGAHLIIYINYLKKENTVNIYYYLNLL